MLLSIVVRMSHYDKVSDYIKYTHILVTSSNRTLFVLLTKDKQKEMNVTILKGKRNAYSLWLLFVSKMY